MNNVLIVLLILCLICSAFFSGTEMALAKVNKVKLARATEKKEKGAKLANKYAENYNDTITIILVGNNLVNIASSAMATILFVDLCGESGEFIALLVVTLTILIFGEILPKSIAASYSYPLSKILSVPLKVCEILFFPITFVVQKILNGFNKRLEEKQVKENEVTDDELIEMVDTMEEQGLIDEDTQELITNAIDFMGVDAVEIMVHRTDFFAFDINDDIQSLLTNPDLLNYSRIPVYDDSVDNIVGILNTKQIIKLHLNGDAININELLTDPLYVFPTQPVTSVLRELRKQNIHMAIIKDEYGGTLGLLTMEDILEELVGEIYDEKDEEEMEEYHKVNDKKFTVDGDMNLYDFFELIEYDYEDFDSIYTTVGGWITDVLGRFPKEKDSFEFEGHLIKVMRASEFTVERVSVLRLQEDENNE